MLSAVQERGGREEGASPPVELDELARVAAQEMLAVALEAERRAYLERHAAIVDDAGHQLVIGNGYHRARGAASPCRRRRSTTARAGGRYVSALLPPWMRRSPMVSEVLPLLYPRGLSTGGHPAPSFDFRAHSRNGVEARHPDRLSVGGPQQHLLCRNRVAAGRGQQPHRRPCSASRRPARRAARRAPRRRGARLRRGWGRCRPRRCAGGSRG